MILPRVEHLKVRLLRNTFKYKIIPRTNNLAYFAAASATKNKILKN